MTIDLSEFFSDEGKEERIPVHVDLEEFRSRLGSFPITEKAPFELHVTNLQGSKLLVSGECDVTVNTVCDRCLTEVPAGFHIEIEEEIPLSGEASEEDTVTAALDGTSLDVDKLVYDEILVNWPTRVLCREDCKGICSVCGQNLNLGTCSCDRSVPDPRMAAIRDLFQQFKEEV